jgi:hypothetical protein
MRRACTGVGVAAVAYDDMQGARARSWQAATNGKEAPPESRVALSRGASVRLRSLARERRA